MRKRKRIWSRGGTQAAVDIVRELIELPATAPQGRTALTFVDSLGIIDRLSFAQLETHVWRWADLLRKRQVEPGTHVAVLVGPSPEWFELTLGLLKVGAVVVPAPAGLDARATERFLRRLEPALVIAGPRAERIARRVDGVEVLGLSEADREMATSRPAGFPAETGEADLAFLLAGEPAATAHTHGSMLAAARQGGALLDVSEEDRVWCSEPPASAVGLYAALGTWSRGAELVFSEGPFDPAETLTLAHRLGVTVLCQPAAELAAMAELPEAPLFDVSDIRRVVSAGPDEAEAREAFTETFGIPVTCGLVLAETGPIARAGPEEEQLTALDGVDIPIVDRDGAPVSEGQTGAWHVGDRLAGRRDSGRGTSYPSRRPPIVDVSLVAKEVTLDGGHVSNNNPGVEPLTPAGRAASSTATSPHRMSSPDPDAAAPSPRLTEALDDDEAVLSEREHRTNHASAEPVGQLPKRPRADLRLRYQLDALIHSPREPYTWIRSVCGYTLLCAAALALGWLVVNVIG